MLLHVWLTVVGICLLGAMSPGPSVALVLKHTLASGRRQGMICGIAHGAGIGLYAFLSVLGLAALITTSPLLFPALQLAGAVYLIWLGLQGLRATGPRLAGQTATPHAPGNAVSSGFLMAFLNPKAALFFFALFSQVIDPATPLAGKLGYAATAMVIDMGWYVSVAWLFSRPRWLGKLERYSLWFERLFGVVLLTVAAGILLELS
jgi:threonine/homoserine/homoserine lactone efflux protein